MTTKTTLLFPMVVAPYFLTDASEVFERMVKFSDGTEFKLIDRYKNQRIDKIRSKLMVRTSKNVDIERFKHTSVVKCYKSLKTYIEMTLDTLTFDRVVLTHAHANDYYVVEKKKYKSFLKFKANTKIRTSKIDQLMMDHYFTYVLLEYCAENNINVVNIWFDPLQMKFNYIENLKIQHRYFHPMSTDALNDQTYRHKFGEHINGSLQVKFHASSDSLYAFKTKLVNTYRTLYRKALDTPKNIMTFGISAPWYFNKFRIKLLNTIVRFNNKQDNASGYYLCYKTRLYNELNIPKQSDNPFLSYTAYQKKISNSISTIMIPSMDENAFSLIRYVESLSVGCIPFVMSNCNYKAGWSYSDSMIDAYKKHDLFIDENLVNESDKMYEHIKSKAMYVSENYQLILYDIYMTDFVQNLMSDEYHQNEYTKLNLLI